MKKIVLSFVVISLAFLTSCGGGEDATSENDNSSEINMGLNYLDFAITSKHQTLDPIMVTDVTSYHILSQIYEPLFRFDEKDLTLQPLLAESYTTSDDHLVYTINLRKGVFFQDNKCFSDGKGREFTSADVLYTFQRICTKKSTYAYSLFKDLLKGCDKQSASGEIEGLQAIDDYTIVFTLNEPSSSFTGLLATISAAIVPKEAIEKNTVSGTGPFVYNKKYDTEKSIILLKNEHYYISDKQKNKLPYIDGVAYNYVKSRQDQLDLFMAGKLDVVTGIPPNSVKDIVESQIADFQNKPVKHILGRYPKISSSFLSLNTAIVPFNNVKIRQALGMAINKEKIVENVLKGEAFGPGNHGVVPSSIKNYDFTSVIGLEYNLNKAKQLLADAGYPNGKGFPTLKFVTRKNNTSLRVALEIQKQLLTNLNINVEISSLSYAEISNLNSSSQVEMSLSSWLGEFPDPNTFLSLFYGKGVPDSNEENSYPNQSRYKNDAFDRLYEQALTTIDENKRYELCLEADQIIATEVPVIPLWYHENYQLIQSSVKNYQPNPMNIQYLINVKIEDVSSKKPK